MRASSILLSLVLFAASHLAAAPPSPDQIYGPLFKDVQMSRVFPDSKTFVDSVPKRKPRKILADYESASKGQDFDLAEFVKTNFIIPQEDVVSHISRLWKMLRREADVATPGSSLLPLPHPYIVPGGRFREIYYWDSYFTMLGLQESGENQLIEDMVDNFDYLIGKYGFIPNGNRSYYLSRSQPPFFSLMVELLAGIKGDDVYQAHLPALRAEYAYWMDETAETKHVVTMPDGSLLNRYYDQRDIPRQESWREDIEVAKKSQQAPDAIYRQLRSAAESGWDFSSRWFADGKSLATIRTTELVPVDLNCLLYHLETTIAKASRLAGDENAAKDFQMKAASRKEAIERYCWSEKDQWYVDYDLAANKQSGELTLAGVTPLFFQLARDDRAEVMAKTIRKKFLRPGGVVTTLQNTGQQWDAPNGWAPLQWMTIQGLRNYTQNNLARDIAKRWIALNVKVYRATGRLMEKYDVIDLTRESGGGEYPSQDGFGWTNGVLLKLIDLYGLPE